MRACIYARVSVTTDESVSISRQIDRCRDYAQSRGWEITTTHTDDGVSATHNRPDQRPGWQAVTADAAQHRFDVVVVYKIDRLARRVTDFLHAADQLATHHVTIAATDDPVDLTSPAGKAVATVLAVFGEMEAANTSARVTAARAHLIRQGRAVGGTVPYGYRNVPAPGGGKTTVKDPDRMPHVERMVNEALRGTSLYSIAKGLTRRGVPTRHGRPWSPVTVDGILRHPYLTGRVPENPGNTGRRRGTRVLRHDDGMPVIREDLRVMTDAQHARLLAILDDDTDPRRKPRAQRAKTPGLLSGLVQCGLHTTDDGTGQRMHRGTTGGRASYTCPTCHQTISNLEPHFTTRFLDIWGDEIDFEETIEVPDTTSEDIARVTEALDATATDLRTASPAARAKLLDRQGRLLAELDRLSSLPAQTTWKTVPGTGGTYREVWEGGDARTKRRLIDYHTDVIFIVPGRRGPGIDPARVIPIWSHMTPSEVEADRDTHPERWLSAWDLGQE